MTQPVFEFVYGGTFDPVHYGHLSIVRRLRQAEPTLPLRVIPCAVPALKGVPGASFAQRVEMLELALADVPVTIDQREAGRPGASYTVDTLRELKAERPERNLLLTMGADAAADIERWHQPEQLTELCHLVIVNRPHYPLRDVEQAVARLGFSQCADFEQLLSKRAGAMLTLYMTDNHISSSDMRAALMAGKGLREMTPKAVVDYIEQHQLYRN